MLKGKRSVSACSLSSCRIRAEALARAFNNRIWPCVWISQRSSPERSDGMSNGIDEEEEFFDASPSPVELEDESLFCQQHSSAATEAGRAKLYELLQQHATDDATDIFYDVSEDSTLTHTAGDTCLSGDNKKLDEALSKNSEFSEHCDGEPYFSSNSDSYEKENKLMFSSSTESDNNSVKNLASDSIVTDNENNQESNLDQDHIVIGNENNQENILDQDNIVIGNENNQENNLDQDNIAIGSEYNQENNLDQSESRGKGSHDENDRESTEKCPVNVSSTHKIDTETNDLSSEDKFISSTVSEKEMKCNIESGEGDMPSSDVNAVESITKYESSSSNNVEQQDTANKSLLKEDLSKNDDNNTVEVTVEIDSPSSSSDKSDSKSPTLASRLHIFEESRPKILRSTSLKTGKTPPGTPSRKKIVRFADVLGLDLEDVRHIMTGDIPIVPSSAYTDLNLRGIDLPSCEPISETVEISRRDSSSWQAIQGATATNILYPLFEIPGEKPDFLDRVRYQGVCLETVVVSDVNIQCTCRVMNYGYHKKVTARYTVNDWLSSNDIDALYMSGSSNGETDSFSFSIFLSPVNRSIKLALKYTVNGREYWDNNRNQNYCFGYHGNDHMHTLPSPLWQNPFW